MTFGLSGAALAGVAIGGATLVSGYMQSQSAGRAAAAQGATYQLGIDEQRRQFDEVQKLLKPYAEAGPGALEAQQALIGLKGPEAERAAIERIRGGETFQALAGQGEEALLQRASATGGLRGGNVQGALAQFRPALLSSLIEQQYGRLGGMTALGQQSAAGVGTAGLQTGVNVANLLGQQGAAQAGAEIAQGKAFAAIPSAISGGLGIFSGLGGKF
tara:strand:+ start:471 stop:1118 length:648 start_codon:yes stop_codon:yes gene_type:complete